MKAVNMTQKQATVGNVDNSMKVLLSKLDEAIDDMEIGRVLTEEEVWTEIDAM